MKDFPVAQDVGIYERCAMLGEEDVVSGNTYETTVKCCSQKGKLLVFAAENFMKLKRYQSAWLEILK